MNASVGIRDAQADELAILSGLAFASKAVWGYDNAFMAACRDELTVAPHHLRERIVRVAVVDDVIVGFHGVEFGDEPELAWLFVAPDAMQRGVGRALLADACAVARGAGAHAMRIEADPNAAGFYERAGAHVVGTVPSGSVPGRALPLLRLAVG